MAQQRPTRLHCRHMSSSWLLLLLLNGSEGIKKGVIKVLCLLKLRIASLLCDFKYACSTEVMLHVQHTGQKQELRMLQDCSKQQSMQMRLQQQMSKQSTTVAARQAPVYADIGAEHTGCSTHL